MNSKPLKVTKSRNANYKLTKIADAFEPIEYPDGLSTSGNIRSQIENKLSYDVTFGAQLSTPYLLARLCALFEGLKINAQGQTAYKITWQTILKHKATGHVVTFYDYKGASSYGSDISGKDTPKAFLRDLKTLLKVLQDNRCPHPYDGCVVGEVA